MDLLHGRALRHTFEAAWVPLLHSPTSSLTGELLEHRILAAVGQKLSRNLAPFIFLNPALIHLTVEIRKSPMFMYKCVGIQWRREGSVLSHYSAFWIFDHLGTRRINKIFENDQVPISGCTLLQLYNSYLISTLPVQRSAQMSVVYPHIFLTVSKENENMRWLTKQRIVAWGGPGFEANPWGRMNHAPPFPNSFAHGVIVGARNSRNICWVRNCVQVQISGPWNVRSGGWNLVLSKVQFKQDQGAFWQRAPGLVQMRLVFWYAYLLTDSTGD